MKDLKAEIIKKFNDNFDTGMNKNVSMFIYQALSRYEEAIKADISKDLDRVIKTLEGK